LASAPVPSVTSTLSACPSIVPIAAFSFDSTSLAVAPTLMASVWWSVVPSL